ncbi:MAG TPA: hypothetical protein VIN56_02190 [Candidatus Dormibacteraeota bacterium]|jgi:hypothetical protein
MALPPNRPPVPGPPPRSSIPPQYQGQSGRRVLLFFSIGAVILVAGFLLFAGAEALYLVRNGKAQVTDTLPANLPKQIPICTGFKPAHTIVVETGGGKRYEVQGDCPENRLQLVDDLTNQMQYIGWTVHDDGTGALSAYDYERHQLIELTLADSASGSNQTTVTMDMQTGVTAVPSGFARPSPSPSRER